MTRTKTWSATLVAGLVLATGLGATAASAAPPTAPTPVASALPVHVQPAALAARTGIEPSPATDAVERALDPTDYVCTATAFSAYADQLVAALSTADLQFLLGSAALDLPMYDALLYGTSSDADHQLEDHATALRHTFRDAQRFWDIRSSDIQLLAMHGDMLLDETRVARLYVNLYGLSPADAAELAAAVHAVVAATPAFRGGDNPLFTLNAFAFSAQGATDPLIASVPDKLIFGDGVLEALDELGLGDVGPRAVLGHEFGHHVQYEDDLFDSPLTGAEATRRTELMADALGTYFAVHARGLSLNAKRVLDAEQSFYEVGDCSFDDSGHHGTPAQRLRASTWGATVADSARPQGRVLPSLTLAARFDAELPRLVAPDAR
jgi:hypothetical protein